MQKMFILGELFTEIKTTMYNYQFINIDKENMGYILFWKKATSVIITVISRRIKSLTPTFDLSKLQFHAAIGSDNYSVILLTVYWL
jgi:hypothetical protein